MKYLLTYTSCMNHEEEIEIPDLLEWVKEQEHVVIVSWGRYTKMFELEIYDDYRE